MQKQKIQQYLVKELDPAFARRAEIIFNEIDLSPGTNILDIGCGRGFYEIALAQLGDKLHVEALDLNSEYLSIAKNAIKNVSTTSQFHFAQGSATKLPYPTNSFNYIICSELLEHVRNDQGVLQEMQRVLKPKGTAILTVPYKNYPFRWDPLNYSLKHLFNTHVPANIWWLAGIWADHIRLYTPKLLKSRIAKANFKVVKEWEVVHRCFPFSHFILYGIGKNIVELGLGGDSVNRFSANRKTPMLIKLIKRILFRQTSSSTGKRYVDIVMKVSK